MNKIIFLFLINFTVVIFAQGSGTVSSSNPRAISMANTNAAASKGLFSVGYNPANLMTTENRHWELTTVLPLPTLNFTVGTDFLTIEDYNYFFGGVEKNGETVGRTLDEKDKQRLLEIFDGGGMFGVDVALNLFSISYKANEKIGAFAFTITDNISSKFNFPQDIVELGLYGNPQNKIYNFDDAEIKSWWIRNYSLSYARDLNELNQNIFERISAGITLKLVHGYSYVTTERVNSTITTDSNNVITANGDFLAYSSFSPDFEVDYDFDAPFPKQQKEDAKAGPFPTPAGKGFGFDLGVNAKLNDIWSFGLAVTDIGSINWTEDVARFSSNTAIYLKDLTDEKEIDSLKDAIKGEKEPWSEISSSLSTALRMGATFQLDKYLDGNFPGEMLIAFDYNQGFNDQPGNTKSPRFSLGTEWKPANWIPIRTGFSFGGLHKFRWAFGFGLDTGLLEFNLASNDFQYLFMQNSAKRISFAFGTLWKF